MKKLPKEVYVRMDAEGYPLANENLIELAELGETHEVGEYKLVRKMKVQGVTEITPEK